MISSSFFSTSRRRGATLAGLFGVALSSVLLLCGAGLTPTGNVQTSDINANGHSITNAATVGTTVLSATNVYANTVVATNGLVAPAINLTNFPGYATMGLGSAATNSASAFAATTDTRFPASVTGFRYGAGAGSADAAPTNAQWLSSLSGITGELNLSGLTYLDIPNILQLGGTGGPYGYSTIGSNGVFLVVGDQAHPFGVFGSIQQHNGGNNTVSPPGSNEFSSNSEMLIENSSSGNVLCLFNKAEGNYTAVRGWNYLTPYIDGGSATDLGEVFAFGAKAGDYTPSSSDLYQGYVFYEASDLRGTGTQSTYTATTVSGSPSITFTGSLPANIYRGNSASIHGYTISTSGNVNIPASTYITDYNLATHVATMSANATGSGSNTVTLRVPGFATGGSPATEGFRWIQNGIKIDGTGSQWVRMQIDGATTIGGAPGSIHFFQPVENAGHTGISLVDLITITGTGLVDAGTLTMSGLTANSIPYLDGSKNLASATLSHGLSLATGTLSPANSYGTASVSSAGNTNLTSTATINAKTITASAGGGSYTASFSLLDAGAVAGDLFELSISTPASTNPVVTVYDNSTGGTLLSTVTSTATAGTTTLSYFFNGTNWVAYKKGAALLFNNLSDLPSASTARTNLGVAIGTNVEAWNATLDAVAANTGTVNLSGTTLTLPSSIGVNTITAASATNLVLNAGSSGAQITLSQGTNADLLLTPSGTGRIRIPVGSVGNAPLMFAGDTTGWYASSTNTWTFASGTNYLSLYPNRMELNSNFIIQGSSTATSLGTPDAGLARSATGTWEINDGILVGNYGRLNVGTISLQQLAVAASPTVTPAGTTGSSTWTYLIVAKQANGSSSGAGATGTTSTGNATLTGTNKNNLSWTAVTGATSYDIYRTVAATSPSTLGKIGNSTTNSFSDTGLAGDASTAPGTNATGTLTAPGNLIASVAGGGLQVKEGSNAKQGTATLSAGTVTVSNTSVTANSRIFLTGQSLGTVTTPKTVAVTARSAGTSFTITSADNTDTSVVAWEIFEPAP